jgi:hypothetical protein
MKPARFISRHSLIIVLVAVALIVPSIYGAINTGVDYNTLNYLPKDLDSMRGTRILDKEFGDASSAFVVVNFRTTRQILDIKKTISEIDGVRAVVWIDDIVDPRIPIEILPEALRAGFFSGDSTLLIVQFLESGTSLRTYSAIKQIRAKTDPSAQISGTSAINKDTQDLSDREIPAFIGLAVVFCMLILGIAMESYLIPFIFLVQIGLAILYNLGSNIVLGKISNVTESLAAVLQLGVTMDFSIFLLHRYEEERKRFADRREAMAEAIGKTFLTIGGGALTEVAGFLALCVMDLGLGADIGVVMAKGVVIGLVCTMTVLPSILLLLDTPIHKLRHRPVLPTFKRTSAFVTKHSVVLTMVFFLLFVPAIFGRDRTKQYYNLVDALPKDLPSVRALNRLKTDYHMTTTHFIIVRDDLPAPAIRELITRVEGVKGIGSVLALEKYVGGLLPQEFLPASLVSIFKTNGQEMIVANSVYTAASDNENRQIDELISIVKTYDPGGLVTGEGALSKDLVSIAMRDFRRVDIVSIGAVFLIILIIFTSLSVPVVLVGSIELAIFINMALPYFLGESVPFIASIVIGCIQLGVTIDYAILLVTRFKEQLRKGLDRHEAMRVALEGSARSIFTSGLALFSATAGVSIISRQAVLQSICSLIARGAIISMGVIIFLLPSLLIISEGLISRTSLNWRRRPRPGSPAKKESSR